MQFILLVSLVAIMAPSFSEKTSLLFIALSKNIFISYSKNILHHLRISLLYFLSFNSYLIIIMSTKSFLFLDFLSFKKSLARIQQIK